MGRVLITTVMRRYYRHGLGMTNVQSCTKNSLIQKKSIAHLLRNTGTKPIAKPKKKLSPDEETEARPHVSFLFPYNASGAYMFFLNYYYWSNNYLSNYYWNIVVPEKHLLLTMLKALTVWITTNCGKVLNRWEYQTT